MGQDLLQLPAKYLLEKIGAGNHKPGSGSAAALNGILSCKLLLTVIELTLDPKRKKQYGKFKKDLDLIKGVIQEELEPRLEFLFEEDSVQFDLAIKKRKERDSESNQRVKNELNEKALNELKKATEIPIEIAECCVKLANYAVEIFNKGFKSARGDTSVALGSSLSAITGCISIINLNLQSFSANEWTTQVQNKNRKLRDLYSFLNVRNEELMNVLELEAKRKNELNAEFVKIKEMYWGKKLTYADIETLARRVQNSLWRFKDLIWAENIPNDVLEVLKPEKVIKQLKFSFNSVQTLGVNEHNEEIAGIINNENWTIRVSNLYKPEVVNFTTAHELGHALMHDKLELHRDIPLDGSETRTSRSVEELQADKFAVFFLMPSKTVSQIFYDTYKLNKFTVNKDTVFALEQCSVKEFKERYKTKRELSRRIAKCVSFNFQTFISLSETFKVSVEAMAIRLEELNLVEYDN